MTTLDKYEYNLKLEEIDKLVDQRDYQEAAKLADTIDWRRVRNVRTLCLISEIYEASQRLEDSKSLLLRAYRRSPSGRSILYRLVEVTTAMKQYDEALEFYTEYVQAAPHDTNRYILKYNIYKGRGSSPEELIGILEEYLGQEYTERWAYELATLYQQAGQIQKCLAACDDLVLWFHSGKYVIKALELKQRYAALTPKQQEIYAQRFDQEEEPDPEEDLEENVMRKTEKPDEDVLAESILAETEKQIAGEVAAQKAELEQKANQKKEQTSPEEPEGDKEPEAAAKEEPEAQQEAGDSEAQEETGRTDYSPENLQMDLARSMREIISGVVKRTQEQEEDIPLSVEKNLQMPKRVTVPEPDVKVAGKLSIDDILLSMGEKGKNLVKNLTERKEEADQEAPVLEEKAEEPAAEAPLQEAEPSREEVPVEEELIEVDPEEEELTEDQKEALRYAENPEKLLRNKNAMPVYRDEPEKEEAETKTEDLGKTQRIVNTREELQKAAEKEILAEKTIRIPAEEIARKRGQLPEEEEASYEEETVEEEVSYEEVEAEEEGPYEEEVEEASYEEAPYEEAEEIEEDASYEEEEEAEDEETLKLPAHLRSLFTGFTEIEGLEEQIANAIIQAEAKGNDRTSRNGNILIFGPHGSGKTTLAMNIAKAVAQDRGSQVMKMAKIYAADLNRKDIAATIAKIAGGTLIIEEAGDLEPGTVEQLTTAMEFRTDGLILILEDEQQYIHDLLMQHPRFTMKFTAQIYIPEYTVEELAMFGQLYANEQDFVISEEGMDRLEQKLSDLAEQGETVAINEVIGIVSGAIRRSNGFFRKISLGKKRYNEQDYVILFAKDFK